VCDHGAHSSLVDNATTSPINKPTLVVCALQSSRTFISKAAS
jgi:hypothetical protein